MDKYNKIIKNRLISILEVLIFLIVSTIIWLNYREKEIVYSDYLNKDILVSDNITLENLKVGNQENIDKIKTYNLTISNQSSNNQDIKIMIARDLLNNSISNNYLKYSINDGRIYSLNMDGIIYIDNLNSKETKDIKLKVFISDTYQGDLNYKGRIIVI